MDGGAAVLQYGHISSVFTMHALHTYLPRGTWKYGNSFVRGTEVRKYGGTFTQVLGLSGEGAPLVPNRASVVLPPLAADEKKSTLTTLPCADQFLQPKRENFHLAAKPCEYLHIPQSISACRQLPL